MNEIFKTALIGTRKQAPSSLGASFPTDELFGDVNSFTLESCLLLRIGCWAVYENAGQPISAVPESPQSPTDSTQFWSKRFQQVMHAALEKDKSELLFDFLRVLQEKKLSPPANILPGLMNTTDPKLQKVIPSILGEHGKWLAEFNPDWSWMTAADHSNSVELKSLKEQWDEGSLAERCDALEHVRRLDSSLGLSWLEKSFKKEKADTRRQFMTCLQGQLSVSDAEFLIQSLSDRSKHVKIAAANLLAQIPGSELSARHCERGLQLLEAVPSVRSKIKLICHPPQDLPKDWQEDGIPLSAPGARGNRSFWTEELVGRIPPDFWVHSYSATPLELVNGILQDDFSHAVITGWTKAVETFHRSLKDLSDWLEPLWKYWSAMTQHPHLELKDQAIEMLALVASFSDKRVVERNILHLIQDQPDPTNAPISQLAPLMTTPWSAAFAKEYLRITRGLVGSRSDRSVLRWLESLKQAAAAIPPELFEAAASPWQVRSAGASSWQVAETEKIIWEFTERIQLRIAFHEELEAIS